MIAHLSLGVIIVLMALTATGYAVATIGMKLASAQMTVLAILVMLVGLMVAASSEIILLRHSNMAIAYLGIIAFESLLVLSYAAFIGETLSPVQLAGAAMVLTGMALVSH